MWHEEGGLKSEKGGCPIWMVPESERMMMMGCMEGGREHVRFAVDGGSGWEGRAGDRSVRFHPFSLRPCYLGRSH